MDRFHRRIIRIASLCLLVLSVASAAQAVPILGMDVIPGSNAISGADQTFGYSFTTSTSFNVTALGLLDRNPDGLVEAHSIGLWSATGTLLASSTIAAGTGTPTLPSTGNGQRWRIVDIDDIILPAGDYVIGALYPGALGTPHDPILIETLLPVPAPGVAYTGLRFATGSSLVFPNLTDNDLGIFGPTFVVDNGVVPAPGSLSLLLLGLFCWHVVCHGLSDRRRIAPGIGANVHTFVMHGQSALTVPTQRMRYRNTGYCGRMASMRPFGSRSRRKQSQGSPVCWPSR